MPRLPDESRPIPAEARCGSPPLQSAGPSGKLCAAQSDISRFPASAPHQRTPLMSTRLRTVTVAAAGGLLTACLALGCGDSTPSVDTTTAEASVHGKITFK